MDHLLMDNRHGLIVGTMLTYANCTGGREAALAMLEYMNRRHWTTQTVDEAHDAADFIAKLQAVDVTPQSAQNDINCRSASDGRTTQYPSYVVGQRISQNPSRAICSRPGTSR